MHFLSLSDGTIINLDALVLAHWVRPSASLPRRYEIVLMNYPEPLVLTFTEHDGQGVERALKAMAQK